jgi:Zn-dependent peptidase ImmA (M78 family)
MALSARRFVFRNEFEIGEHTYKAAWCERIEGKDTLGYCDDEAKVIYVKDNQNLDECFSTILHELVHAMNHEYGMKLKHTQVYKLERALADLLVKNGLIKL